MFNFGTNNAAAKPATVTGTTGFTFGNTSTATTTSSSTTPSTFSFGKTTTPAASTTTTTAASTGFSFGSTPATTTAATTTASTGLFGATAAATTTTTASSGGLFGTTPAATTSSGGLFGATSTSTTTPASLTAPTATKPGLGGSGFTTGQTGSSKPETETKQPIKQQTLPKEIKELVTNLEGFIKKEKEESNKVAKYSQRELTKIKENADQLEIVIKSVKSSLQREGSSVKKLSERAVELHNGVAMAQRTNDTHAALQHENCLPSRYFAELVKEFESTLTIYRAQIDNLESHLAAGTESIINQLPNSLERLHQTFIALAANLQIILGQLDKMKQRYLAYRRHQGDTTDVFARKKPRSEKALVGPSPFAELSNLNVLALAQIQSQQQQAAQPQQQAAGTTGGLFGNTTSNTTSGGLFGNTSTSGGLFGNTSKPASGGLFGNTSSNTTGGLFGNTSTSTSGGLFGNTSTSKPASTFSFGNTTTTTQSGSLFGNSSGFSFGAKK